VSSTINILSILHSLLDYSFADASHLLSQFRKIKSQLRSEYFSPCFKNPYVITSISLPIKPIKYYE
jgi:hypothetical protein